MYNRIENKTQAKNILRGNSSCILFSSIFWKYVLGILIQFGILIVATIFGIIPFIGTLIILAYPAYCEAAMINFTKTLVETGKIEYSSMFNFITDWKFLLKYLVVILLFGLVVSMGLIFLIVPGVYLFLRFSLVTYCLNDDHSLGIIECFKKSSELMYGRKLDLFILSLSMIGWTILGYATLGIVSIYLTVYMNVILYIFFKMAKDK